MFALVSLFSPLNKFLLNNSRGTLIVCNHQSEGTLIVINVKLILAMVLFHYAIDSLDNNYFMIEKIGLDVVDIDTYTQEDKQP